MNAGKAKRLVVGGDGKNPPRHYVGGGRIRAEDLEWMYEKLTGRRSGSSQEDMDRINQELDEAYAKLERRGEGNGEDE